MLRVRTGLAGISVGVGLLAAGCSSPSQTPHSLVHWSGIGGPFANVSGMVADERGNVWITQAGFNRLLRVSSRGQVATVAQGQFSDPTELAVDREGRILVADSGNNRIDMIDSAGLPHVIAGTGTPGGGGDGGPALQAQLNHPEGVAVAEDGDIFIADTGNNRIREITADGNISTLAGSGTAGYSGDSGPNLFCRRAPEIRFNRPTTLEADSPTKRALNAETVYVLDAGNKAIRQIRRFVDTSLPPPAPAAVCPQVMTFGPSAGTPAIANPIHMAVAYGLGVLVSSVGSRDLFVLGSLSQADYSTVSSGRFTPTPSPAWTPGAIAANQHSDLFMIDTSTGQLHHIRYQVPTA